MSFEMGPTNYCQDCPGIGCRLNVTAKYIGAKLFEI
jgi:hypothetical protein